MNHCVVSCVYSIGTMGVGVHHVYKTKGPYNLMVTRAKCFIVRTSFGLLLIGNFHIYSIPRYDVTFCNAL